MRDSLVRFILFKKMRMIAFRLLFLFFLVLVILPLRVQSSFLLVGQKTYAPSPPNPPLPPLSFSFQDSKRIQSRRMMAIPSKNRNPNGSSSSSSSPSSSNSGWDSFKNVIYGSVDGLETVMNQFKGQNQQEENSKLVRDGYSEFEQSVKEKASTPGTRLVREMQARAVELRVDPKSQDTKGGEKKKSSSSFSFLSSSSSSSWNVFKDRVFPLGDIFSQPTTKEEDDKDDETKRLLNPSDSFQRNTNVPYRKGLAKELSPDILSSNPIKRFQAEQEIREREARERAKKRGEIIQARKEDLYRIVDAIQDTMDAIPERIGQVQKVLLEASSFVQSVPGRVESAVEEVKAIPDKVERQVLQTKQKVEADIEATKRVVNEVQEIPNKVVKTVEDTKSAVVRTKESVDETVTKVKVLVGMEKPKPKPPKLPPPQPPSTEKVLLDLASRVAFSAGKLVLWAGQGVASFAWEGVMSAVTNKPSQAPKLESSAVQNKTSPVAPVVAAPNRDLDVANQKLETETEALKDEVAEALRLAEASLRKAEQNKSNDNKDE